MTAERPGPCAGMFDPGRADTRTTRGVVVDVMAPAHLPGGSFAHNGKSSHEGEELPRPGKSKNPFPTMRYPFKLRLYGSANEALLAMTETELRLIAGGGDHRTEEQAEKG